jgi:hypothetical protein
MRGPGSRVAGELSILPGNLEPFARPQKYKHEWDARLSRYPNFTLRCDVMCGRVKFSCTSLSFACFKLSLLVFSSGERSTLENSILPMADMVLRHRDDRDHGLSVRNSIERESPRIFDPTVARRRAPLPQNASGMDRLGGRP